jgi:glycosidase
MRKIVFALLAAIIAGSVIGSQPVSASASVAAPSWIEDAVIYEVNIRQYTEAGTFDAFAEHLPRLKELGVDVLWLMPVTPISQTKRLGTLGSYYSVDNYTGINPEYGDEQDFQELIDAAHDQGFRVILDWVANHTGWDNAWISAHPDWYTKDSDGNIIHPAGTTWEDVADLNFTNTQMRAAMIYAMKYWVNTYDIDGFRCDYASGVPQNFWNEASLALNSIKPLFMLAEDSTNFDLMNTAFDANYSWQLKDVLNTIGTNKTGVSDLTELVANQKNWFPTNTFPMNFITNHDENSWSGTEFERLGNNVDAMTAVYFTLPGVPLIYTGQEISLNRRLKFFDKDSIDWNLGTPRPLLAQLAQLKSDSPALDVGPTAGSFKNIPTGQDSVIAYVRSRDAHRVITLANFSNRARSVKLAFGSDAGSYREVSSNVKTVLLKNTTITIPAYGYKVLTNNTLGSQIQKVTKISLTTKNFKVARNSVTTLIPQLSPRHVTNATIAWKSTNPKVVKVYSNGVVKALKKGVAKVWAISSNSNVKTSVTITVK